MTVRLAAFTAQGVSLWLDDLSRQRLHSGNLKNLIDTWHISGVTTNPSIFQAALKDGASYQRQLDELADPGHHRPGRRVAQNRRPAQRADQIPATLAACPRSPPSSPRASASTSPSSSRWTGTGPSWTPTSPVWNRPQTPVT